MSEPWIRLYVADMRGDPKISALTPAQRLLLIHMWDLAKNGPGDPTELRDVDGKPMTPKRLMQVCGCNDWGGVDPLTDTPSDPPSEVGSYQGIKGTIDKMLKIGLCRRNESGAIAFPTLLRRQGLDRTNASRQARFRARNAPESNGKVTPEVTAEVTAEGEPDFVGEEGESNGGVTAYRRARSRSQKEPPGSSAPPSSLRSEGSAPLPAARCAAQQDPEPGFAITPAGTRRCDELWEALTDELDIDTAELTKPARGSLNAAVKALRDVGATPGDVHVRCARYRRQMGVALTAPALAKHWAALARDRAAVVRSPDARRDRAAEIAAMGERRIS